MAHYSGRNPKWMSTTGWILTMLIFLLMGVMPALMLGARRDAMSKQTGGLGFGEDLVPVLAGVEIACALIYVFPKTSVFGAILLTGYLGGAVCAHARLHQREFFFPVVIGIIAWLGVYLRDRRVRELIPWR